MWCVRDSEDNHLNVQAVSRFFNLSSTLRSVCLE